MTEYNIISAIKGKAPKQKNICCFAHYDKDGIIDTYVIQYLKQIKEQLKCEIIFTSTAPSLRNPEDIADLCSQIIHRENQYYDFGSYLYGYSLINPNDYDNILFANDSVYGAFYDISHLPQKMQNFDIWGITDSIDPTYHIQSYFLWFNKSAFEFLAKFVSEYSYPKEYNAVIQAAEIGLSQLAIKDNLNITALCPFENIMADTAIINKKTEESFTEGKILRGLAKHKYKKYRNSIYDMSITNNAFHNWQKLIEEHECPTIKIKLIKDKKFFYLHQMKYDKIIRNMFPEYDINLIRKHMHRVGY